MHLKYLIRLTASIALLSSLYFSVATSSARVPLHQSAGSTNLVSISSAATQGNGISWWSSVSADGRYVAFHSSASNLVDGDTNNFQDVFLRDLLLGETTRVSVASDGAQGYFESGFPKISSDGRFIVFVSMSPNLVDGDANGYEDIFLHELSTGETTRVSIASNGTQANGRSYYPSISANGRFVAFQSTASNLVEVDENGVEDIFVHDVLTGETTCVSRSGTGIQGNQWSDQASISPDGLYVAFRSYASNLVPGDVNNVCDTDQDGLFDDNCQDVFLHQRLTGETTLVSIATEGSLGNNWSGWPSVSAGGRYVVFQSWAEDLVENDTNGGADIFLHDTFTGQTTRVSITGDATEADCYSTFPSITADGRFVAFESCASNLVEGDDNGRFDIFVRDRITHRTTRISIASDGTQTNADSGRVYISANAHYVVFDSYATNLVIGDNNEFMDVFIRDRGESSSIFLPLMNH
jgi:Tol biopolymer transport system component